MRYLGYIDALRGYAILAVIAVHTSQIVPGLGWPARPLLNQGARGVQLFYVVSALTICMSWFKRSDGIGNFYIRRLFRIAPMFWLAVLFFVLLDGFVPRYWAPSGIGWLHIAATFSFIHGLHPETITSVVPGGWTIANEALFYALFPMLIFFIRSTWLALIAVLFGICLSEYSYEKALYVLPSLMPGEDRGLVSNYAFLWFPNQLPAFLVGILSFYVLRHTPLMTRKMAATGLAACLYMVIQLAFLDPILQVHTAYALVFGAAVVCMAHIDPSIISSRTPRWIGRVSFSAYLWHFAVLDIINHFYLSGFNPLQTNNPSLGIGYFLLMYVFIATLTVGLSSVTYHLVERRFIEVGDRLTRRRRDRIALPILE